MAKKLINKIVIAGCGPGSRKYITSQAVQRIKDADVLVGSRRLLAMFPNTDAEKYILNKNYKLLITRIISLSSNNMVVVLVSGDPGFYSYAKLIIDSVGAENCEVIPGISSVQLAFAKIGRTWNDACFLSMHGRSGKLAKLAALVSENGKVAVLTDNANNVKLIAKKLLDEGLKDRMIYVCENLSLDKERIRKYDVTSMQKVRANGLNVIIILDEDSGE